MTTIKRTRVSEGSCWRCRKRRIRCDLTKPSCIKCQESEQECSYGAPPLKWIGGMAFRGRNAPTALTYRSPPVESGIINSSSSMTRKRCDVSIPPMPVLKQLDSSALFRYFSNAVLPRFQVLDDHIPVELHVFNKDQPLQQAILAVARSHHSFLTKCDLGGTVMARSTARLAAINSFRKKLEEGVVSDRAAQDMFTINVLLCMLDGMIEPARDLHATMFHLRGGFAMLSRWPSIPCNMLRENGFQAHLLSVFVTMDLVHAILAGCKPYFHSKFWIKFADIRAWWGRLQASDTFLTVLDAHSQIAFTGQFLQNGGDVLPMEDRLATIESLLLTLATGGQTEWERFCLFYVISCSIYFHRVVRQRPIEAEVIQSLVRRGISLLAEEVLSGMQKHCVVLPMLVIGSHCITEQDRQVVREALSPSLSYLSFGNMPVMADFLRASWERHDMQATWCEMFYDIADKIFLF